MVGTGPARATIATTTPVNSCAGNQTTGTVICTDNLTGIYLINGNTLSQTLSQRRRQPEDLLWAATAPPAA